MRIPKTTTKRTTAVLMLAAMFSLPAAADEYQPPEWFENARVQAHSEHGLPHTLRLTPEWHAEIIASLGAKVATRIFLNVDEGAWWPTKVGESSPEIGDRDIAKELVEAFHAKGMRVFAYHRHMCDSWYEREYPERIAREPDGSKAMEPRARRRKTPPPAAILCMNTPYHEFVKTRLLELAERGVDGLYFDSYHMPQVCACEACRKTWEKRKGRPMPVEAQPGSDDYMEMVAFTNDIVYEAFKDWRETIHAKYPGVMLAIGSSRYPMYFMPQIDEKLVAVSDTSKTEYHKPFGRVREQQRPEDPDFDVPPFDDQFALGWSTVRDPAAGRPPIMWIPFIESERTSLYSAAAAVTYGCVASLNIPLHRNPEVDVPNARERFPSSFAMGDKVSPYLAYTRPYGWAALHVSEDARNRRYPDMEKMAREVFAPALGAFMALRAEHMPHCTVADDSLAGGLAEPTKVLILPWPDELNDAQRKAVADFETKGGQVIRLEGGTDWSSKAKKPALLGALRERLRRAGPPPVSVSGPEDMHAMTFRRADDGRVTVAMCNTWRWFETRRRGGTRMLADEPPPCKNVTVRLDESLGKPKKAIEAVTGKALEMKPVEGGVTVAVPTFQVNAVVSFEF